MGLLPRRRNADENSMRFIWNGKINEKHVSTKQNASISSIPLCGCAFISFWPRTKGPYFSLQPMLTVWPLNERSLFWIYTKRKCQQPAENIHHALKTDREWPGCRLVHDIGAHGFVPFRIPCGSLSGRSPHQRELFAIGTLSFTAGCNRVSLTSHYSTGAIT